MKIKLFAALASITLIVAGLSIAASMPDQDKGAMNIELPGGKRGNVSFPHHQHQNNLGDCEICHSVFPQKLGIIEELKAEGKLKKKYVMNKLCTKCHKEKKKAGQKSGPVTCAKCHMKEKA
jgi:hypothetical protein